MILKKNPKGSSFEIERNKYEHFNVENPTSKLFGIGLYKNNEKSPIIWFELNDSNKTISFYRSNVLNVHHDTICLRFQDNYLLEFKDYTLNQA